MMFEYIEVFYNRKRRHSTLGYAAPLSSRLVSNNPHREPTIRGEGQSHAQVLAEIQIAYAEVLANGTITGASWEGASPSSAKAMPLTTRRTARGKQPAFMLPPLAWASCLIRPTPGEPVGNPARAIVFGTPAGQRSPLVWLPPDPRRRRCQGRADSLS